MATKYARATGKAGQISQDPAEIDTNITSDSGVTAEALGASAAAGGSVATPLFGVAGAHAIIDDTTYVDDADGSVGSVSEWHPGSGGANFANEKLTALGQGGVLPGGEAAAGTLTIAEPVGGTKSASGMDIQEPVTDGDTFIINGLVYTMKDTPAAAYDVEIGANEAASKLNIERAINASGTEGVEYFAGTLINPDVVASAFSGDGMVVTAREFGTAEDAITLTETFTHANNTWDDATLSGTAGEAIDTMTIGTTVYRFLEVPIQAYDIDVGANEAATKVNIVAAINRSGTEGVEYFAGTEQHPDVSAAAFSTDTCLITAKVGGIAGDAIVFTETFDHTSNVMNGSGTLGADSAGIAFNENTNLEPIGISADVALVDQN